MTSVFATARDRIYKHRYHVELTIPEIHGGTPADPRIVEGWLRSKIADNDAIVQDMIARTLIERGVADDDDVELDVDGAIGQVAAKKVNGFKRDPETGELYVEGRQVKAMIKEAANIRWAKDRWGPTNKGTRSFFAEHVFVLEDRIPLGVKEPDGIDQRQVNTFRGTSFNYEEYVKDVVVAFTLVTDHDFKQSQWADLFVTAEQNGLGSSRSQGYGRFTVTNFDKIT